VAHTPAESGTASIIAEIVRAPAASPDLLPALLGVQARLGGARSAAILRVVDAGRVDAVCEWHADPSEADAAWMAAAAEVVGAGDTDRADRPILIHADGGWIAVVPLIHVGEPGAGAAFWIDAAPEDEARRSADRLHLGVVSLWAHRVASVRDGRAVGPDRVRRAVEIAGIVSRGRTMREVGASVVHELASALRAERVCLGIARGGARGWIRLEFVSGVERVRRSMALVPPVESAMEECGDQDQEIVVPEDAGTTVIARSHRALSEHLGGACVASLPVRGIDPRDPIVGVVTIDRAASAPIDLDDLAFIRLVLELVSSRLAECRERSGWIGSRMIRSARRWAGRLVGPDHALTKVLALAGALLLIAGLVVRREEWIPAPATVVAAESRVRIAPMDATLVSVDVMPGDRVIGGETVLGRLDDSDARLELAEAVARSKALDQAEAAARGRGETAEALIASAQRAEVSARIALLEERIARLTIVAPIDGVVVHAPERRRIGAMARAGEELFEIASDDRVRFEAMAPVRWIAEVGIGAPGRLTLAGAPGEAIEVVLDQAEAVVREGRDGAPTDRFLVSGPIPAATGSVRIGMRAVVRIRVGEAPIAAIWTRSIADAVRAWGWW
jgi:multidrug resistance efflux pump